MRLRHLTNEILEMAISDLNIRKPISLFAEFADWRAESGFRQLDKKRNLTNWLWVFRNLFACWLKVVGEQTWRKDKKKEIQTHWQPEKRENPFRAVVKVLKRKIFSTSFSLFDFKTDRKNELKNKKTEYLFVNLFSVQRFNFKKKENINLTTNLSVFGWKMRFNRRLNCGFRSESSLNGRNLNDWKTTNYDHLTHAYVHRLADVHFAGFAPAFTLSFHDSEYARKPPVPIASVVSSKPWKKGKNNRIWV